MFRKNLIIVDDEKLIRWSLEKQLSKEGYDILTAASGQEVLEIINRKIPDLLLLDVKLPDINGIDLLKQIKEIDNEIVVIMMTAYQDIETAVHAIKLGAYDYISKPLEIEKMKKVIKEALEKVSLQKEVTYLRELQQKTFRHEQLVGRSSQITQVFDLISKMAPTDATVLISGESGTGKDLVSRAIHQQSQRAKGPFIDINCAAVPETLLENELFGHEKGAYTDAKELKKGLFEMAKGGTIFLDEIGDMALPMQSKILKVSENKRLRRIGATKELEVDVRIITATNKDLAHLVKEGRFREDLYWRLKVVVINLPSLRERKGDIPLLVDFFIDQFNKEYKTKCRGVTKEVLERLVAYNWPGNVRELRNVIERCVILCGQGHIMAGLLPSEIYNPFPKDNAEFALNQINLSLPPDGISLEQVEKELIKKALVMTKGNQTKAARLLRISRDTLRYRIEKFNLEEACVEA
ncbi:MAG: sigma-54-dependent Fis family transcriptional regulator [Candidatus Tectomicrobia bacterium]|uniref:Sigma-54-dependent Fis family transcriptional regulator n=1 Tax=Tectimicrobiota bacterium TaxID=2528274 RepID=A0A933GNR1_UNCTE|nr:sigma-54-dependent Fis family transcriptional regulator [Candidatus Tectomicrobia bacterium]